MRTLDQRIRLLAPTKTPAVLKKRSAKDACLVDRKSWLNSRPVQNNIATRTKRPKPYGVEERSFTTAIMPPKIINVTKCPAILRNPLSKEFTIASCTRNLNSTAEKENSNGAKLYAIIMTIIISR